MEEDEVLQELDLFVCPPSTSASLYQLQFPLRPAHANFAEKDNIKARFKPKLGMLELSLELNTESVSYNKARGQLLAKDTTDDCFKRQVLRGSHLRDKQCGNYAVGMVKNGNEIHLQPLSGSIQMRPDFSHLDRQNAQREMEADIMSAAESTDSEVEGGSTIRVRFKREETALAKKRREQSAQHRQQIEEDQPWVKLDYKLDTHTQSSGLRENMFSAEPDAKPKLHFERNQAALLRLVCPRPEEQQTQESALPSDVLPLSQMRLLTLNEQIQSIMRRVQSIRFCSLLSLLPPDCNPKMVIQTLQDTSVLIQGCWVIKSDCLFGSGANRKRAALSHEALCKARDFVLLQYQEGRTVTRRDVNDAFRLPDDQLVEILTQISIYVQGEGWKFRLEKDMQFIENHPSIVEQQSSMWQFRSSEIQKLVSETSAALNKQRNSKPRGRPPNDSRAFTSRSFSGSDSEEGKKKPRQRKNSARTVEIPAVNGQAAQLPQDPLSTELRQFLYENFSSRPVISLEDIRKLLELKRTESPATHILNSDGIGIDDRIITEAAKQLGAVPYNASQTCGNCVFLFSGGCSWPEARKCLVGFLQLRNKFRFQTFKTQASAELQMQMPSDADLKRLLLEYCSLKAGIYTLLGT